MKLKLVHPHQTPLRSECVYGKCCDDAVVAMCVLSSFRIWENIHVYGESTTKYFVEYDTKKNTHATKGIKIEECMYLQQATYIQHTSSPF